MRHDKYNLDSFYCEDGRIKTKKAQIEMIRRHYTGYMADDDWVLWIVADLFHLYTPKELVGTIEIKNRDGSLIEKPFLVRTPYPNKNIHQMSMKSGQKRLYGIPLVFKTFESLSEIAEIKIRWDIYEELWDEDIPEPIILHVSCLGIKYNVSFKQNNENPNYRFFTIFSKDKVLCSEKDDEYMKEFDAVSFYVGNLIFKINGDLYGYPCVENLKDNKLCNIENFYKKIAINSAINEINRLVPNKEKVKELIKNIFIKDEVALDVFYYEKAETLVAEYMADFLVEPCFGFQSKYI